MPNPLLMKKIEEGLTSFSLEVLLPNFVVALPLGSLRGPDQYGDYN